ncbi:MAG TPA: carboxypeptidase-like regulatory domain-containing protein, partial [Candidatus Sulfotelmatobacter sp.]|nr:carboxypeptidase-like regulatory domain-containing protein [Candidatus Sulfotelmatobacter sp.]
MKFSWKLSLLLLLPLCVVAAHSQQTGITGVVTDPQGAVVQGAKVEAKQAGAASFFATTNNTGVFLIPNLSAAQYTITVSAPNFSTAE